MSAPCGVRLGTVCRPDDDRRRNEDDTLGLLQIAGIFEPVCPQETVIHQPQYGNWDSKYYHHAVEFASCHKPV